MKAALDQRQQQQVARFFEACANGDVEVLRGVLLNNRSMARMSFEDGLTPLHFAISRERCDIVELLTELGADLEAKDMSGQTALAVAMLRGDREAMSRLHAAGAKPPACISYKPTRSRLIDGGTARVAADNQPHASSHTCRMFPHGQPVVGFRY